LHDRARAANMLVAYTLPGGHIMRSNIPRVKTLCVIVAAIIGTDGTAGHAERYPSRPVKAVTDVGTGGTYDIFGARLRRRTQQALGPSNYC
jgi:hypothetical protein